MKVELITIGSELLASDILDTNAVYLTRSLQEIGETVTCRVMVGDDVALIVDALLTALRRAELVIATGGMGQGADDVTRQALTAVSTQLSIAQTELSVPTGYTGGVQIDTVQGRIVALPGNRREMAHLLETAVLPYLRQPQPETAVSGWVLLRTVGIMESTLKDELADLSTQPQHRITFNSFAGQTNIRIWTQQPDAATLSRRLSTLEQVVRNRFGDHIFGFESDSLESVVMQNLCDSNLKLAIAEIHTNQICARMLTHPSYRACCQILPAPDQHTLATLLHMPSSYDNLTQWCRSAAEHVRQVTQADLGLVIYNNMSQSGVQIIATLASPHGVSVTSRSFGGHPENIEQWSLTQGLAHLRRWLQAHTHIRPLLMSRSPVALSPNA